MKVCQVCKQEKCDELINFGHHPVCHKFTNGTEEKEEKFSLALGQCKNCGLVQLMSPISVNKLIPRYDWIAYNEPEEHLDFLAKNIIELPGINKSSVICGVSYKEDTILERLNRLGFENTWRMDMNHDLGIANSKANLESIQQQIRPNIINSIHKKHPLPDVIIVRHILEHTHNTHEFMSALKQLVKPSGYIIFEVPDCAKGFEILDYTTIWEEHSLYFTEATFKMCMNVAGLKLHHFEKYNYTFENVLIGIVKIENINDIAKSLFLNGDVIASEKKRAHHFSKHLTLKEKSIKDFLSKFVKKGNNIVMFGTGHAACMFINLFKIKDLIAFAIDDNQKKQGFYLPGSKLPIQSTQSFFSENKNNDLCLLGLSSESEKKVIEQHQLFEKIGGVFASIYSGSKYAIEAFTEKRIR